MGCLGTYCTCGIDLTSKPPKLWRTSHNCSVTVKHLQTEFFYSHGTMNCLTSGTQQTSRQPNQRCIATPAWPTAVQQAPCLISNTQQAYHCVPLCKNPCLTGNSQPCCETSKKFCLTSNTQQHTIASLCANIRPTQQAPCLTRSKHGI